jgi:hypothetical protein
VTSLARDLARRPMVRPPTSASAPTDAVNTPASRHL